MGNKLDTLPADLKKIAEEMLAEKYPEPKSHRPAVMYSDYPSPYEVFRPYEDGYYQDGDPSRVHMVELIFQNLYTGAMQRFNVPREKLQGFHSREEMEYRLTREFQRYSRDPLRLVHIR